MKKLILLILISLSVAGCQSQRRSYGGGFHDNRSPKVEISVVRFDPSVDTPPTPTMAALVAISFPFALRRAGITGDVLATAVIEEDGKVSSVVIDQASQSEFATPVISDLPRCLFFPAKRSGVGVRCVTQCKILFTLEED